MKYIHNIFLKKGRYNRNMIKYIFTAFVGYLFGSLNPSAFLSKIKQKDLREVGTKNLGATNVTITFGKGFGAVVMAFDILKAFIPYKFFQFVFGSSAAYIGMVAGVAAVVGHIFPFYLGFRGGKGLASFGGLVLAYSPSLFFYMLLTALALMVIVNYSVAMPIYAGIVFPIAVAVREHSIFAFALVSFLSLLLIVKFLPNISKIKKGEEIKIRDYIKKHI